MKLIKDLGLQYATKKSTYRRKHGLFECVKCKKHIRTSFYSESIRKSDLCRSCLNIKNKTTHGQAKSPEWNTWMEIKRRCFNAKCKSYKYYGGKGIKVCDEWVNNYEQFFKDMGKKPFNNYSIDRIDSDKNYSPDNCRWADISTQSNNRGSNRLLTYKNKTLTMAQWAKKIGINYDTLRSRLDRSKWPLNKALEVKIK